MNPPIPKSVCEEEMQNANLDTNEVIIDYITDAHGNKVKKLKPLFSQNQIGNMFIIYIVTIISLLYLRTILYKRGK